MNAFSIDLMSTEATQCLTCLYFLLQFFQNAIPPPFAVADALGSWIVRTWSILTNITAINEDLVFSTPYGADNCGRWLNFRWAMKSLKIQTWPTLCTIFHLFISCSLSCKSFCGSAHFNHFFICFLKPAWPNAMFIHVNALFTCKVLFLLFDCYLRCTVLRCFVIV